MTMNQEALDREWNAQSEQNPFAEAMAEAVPEAESTPAAERMAPLDEGASPFAESLGEAMPQSESDRLLAQAFAELRDEAFDEAVAFLTEETEQAVADRFTDESPSSSAERERYADAQLSSVRFEAGQYLESLEQALAGQDLESLSEEQLSETLDRFEPQTGEMTPAGEEFIGAIVRKAKKVVKFVANTAKTVGKVAGKLLGPVLQRLKKLINPLLKRVLSMAIGRLPAALQPAARTLAAKITSEALELEGTYEASTPTNLVDVETLAESFDAALAEAITGEATGDYSGEYEEPEYEAEYESAEDGRALEHLAQARGALIDRIRSADDNEDLAPAVEQFAPVLLGALRVGINLVGRSKVVRFLAGYLGKLISRWVGPQLSGPLSNAIVDTGMRLVALEAEDGTRESRGDEAAPVALASVVEDTVRRLAENEDYVFENEDLLQLAAADAFGEAVATHFPQNLVRPPLRQAPSVGGTFVARRPRSVRTYRKYNRTPEVEITAQVADALPTFGGSTVGAVLRAAGATFPFRARMHIYQSATGTTLPRMIRTDRGNGARGAVASSRVHPLTPEAAGLLLREPKLGATVAPAFLRSRNRIAVGQRFYLLEPVNAAGALAMPPAATRAAASRLAPSRAWIVVNLRRAKITVGFYLSEADTQTVADGIRQGRGPVLLQALTRAYRAMQQPSASAPAGHVRIVREDSEDHEDEAARSPVSLPSAIVAVLRRRIDAWVLPALATWARANGEAFARAAGHPDAGVTIRVRLSAVPGLDVLAPGGQGATPATIENALRGTPTIAITVTPGRRRK